MKDNLNDFIRWMSQQRKIITNSTKFAHYAEADHIVRPINFHVPEL